MEHWNTRKSFLLLTEEDEQKLKLIQPLIDRCVDELVEAFYQHLLGFSETRKLLTDQLITTRLMDAQKGYLRSLVSGPLAIITIPSSGIDVISSRRIWIPG